MKGQFNLTYFNCVLRSQKMAFPSLSFPRARKQHGTSDFLPCPLAVVTAGAAGPFIQVLLWEGCCVLHSDPPMMEPLPQGKLGNFPELFESP